MSRLLDATGKLLLPSSGDVQLVTPGSTSGCSCCAPPFNGSISSCTTCVSALNGSSHAFSVSLSGTQSLIMQFPKTTPATNESAGTYTASGGATLTISNWPYQCVWLAASEPITYFNPIDGVFQTKSIFLEVSFTNILDPILGTPTDMFTPIFGLGPNNPYTGTGAVSGDGGYLYCPGATANTLPDGSGNAVWRGSPVSTAQMCGPITVGPWTWTPTVTP
jgi:hypothetical protein